jgi:hypothetical protein
MSKSKYGADFWRILLEDTRDVMKLRPHSISPKSEPLGDFDKNGNFVRRRIPPSQMTQDDWDINDCTVYTLRAVIWEHTPKGNRVPNIETGRNFNVEHLHLVGDNEYDHRFGSCMCCFRDACGPEIRVFGDPDITRHPCRVPLKDPRPARLGRCGCTICNGCILALEERFVGRKRKCFPCPYCGDANAFFVELKIWPISHRVFLREVETSRAEAILGTTLLG